MSNGSTPSFQFLYIGLVKDPHIYLKTHVRCIFIRESITLRETTLNEHTEIEETLSLEEEK